MTAEIAILNSSGIALAADSAVTIGSQKVYNSANKLFTLSKYHPVGVMIYDSADLMDIPWEIIIKEYRSKLGKKSFPTLEEYANDFWNHLSQNEYLIPNASKEQYVAVQAISYLNFLFGQLENKVKEQISTEEETSLEKTYAIFLEILEEVDGVIFGADFLPGFSESDAKEICDDNKVDFETLTQQNLGELFGLLNEEDKERIYIHISSLFVRDKWPLRTSGVVIAGFGEIETFPKIASYLVEGIVGTRIKKMFNEGKSNIQNKEFVTTIVPFAQDEMVWTFMDGIDPDISDFAMTYLRNVFAKYPESLDNTELSDNVGLLTNIKKKLSEDGESLLQEFNNDLYKFQRKNNSQPIIDMVAVLPKDELAAMAESLVNLTVFKRKVSKAVETVGGPIDVAVISKGDGFIWVKRKHYFKPELNQHFFTNYYGGD
jgi:hypothetical protein